MKSPDPMSGKNHGNLEMKEPGGGTIGGLSSKIRIPYGRDNSFWTGKAADERGQAGFKGGDRDLSSSISGASAANGRGGK